MRRLSDAFRNSCVTTRFSIVNRSADAGAIVGSDVHVDSIELKVSQRKPQSARFPGYFVSGQDTVSQAQIMDHARMLGWKLRPGETGSMIASRDESDVVLPSSGLKYSVEMSAQLVAALNPHPYVPPGRGGPGSPELDELIRLYRLTDLPTVGVGRRWAPFLPQIREPDDGAPALRSLDEDMQAVAEQRWEWAQPWHPESVTAENRDDVQRRSKLWRAETKSGKPATKWRPCSHVAICMWASCSRHLNGKSDDWIGEHVIEAKDPRTIRRAIAIGNKAWASLGAWPWAASHDGALDAHWSDDDEVWAVYGSTSTALLGAPGDSPT